MENINLKIEGEKSTLTILNGKTLDPKAPERVSISGSIDSPLRFLKKRVSEINQKTCIIIVNRDKMTISLTVNETDPFLKHSIVGKLLLHPDFLKFKINSGETWSTFDLADFIRMNRSFFESKEKAGQLVKQLREFKAKVDKEIELSKDDRANFSAKRAQVVTTNIPESFVINVPVFIGQPKQAVLVEINIHPETLQCKLCSPEANDMIAEYKEKAIEEQILSIEDIAKDIVIIEE